MSLSLGCRLSRLGVREALEDLEVRILSLRFLLLSFIALLFLATASEYASARERIRVVGSSTVFPFATVVAERFSLARGVASPIIESTGTGGGIKLFCGGVSENSPDITNASSRMKASQLRLCAKNGVVDVIEVAIGYDGIVLAQSLQGEAMGLSLRYLYMALAKSVPDGKGGFIDNPYSRWSDIDSSLPNTKIEVLGPPPTSGTRVAFTEIVMDGGARSFPELVALRKSDKQAFKKIAYAIREDGAYIDSGENDNLIVQKLRRNPKALGIFGFSFLKNNRSLLRGLQMDNVAPEFANIADGSYPIARSLYFYLKARHVEKIPHLLDYVHSFISENAIGADGFLIDEGLIPLSVDAIKRTRADVASMRSISASDLK